MHYLVDLPESTATEMIYADSVRDMYADAANFSINFSSSASPLKRVGRSCTNMRYRKKLKAVITSSGLGEAIWMAIRTIYVKYICLKPCERLQKYGKRAIREVHSLLTSSGLPYYADYGTLLGIVRDRGFIKHDDDIDFSVPPGSPSPEKYLEVLKASKKLIFCWGFEYHGRITELTFQYKGILIDFFFSSVEDGLIYNYVYDYTPDLIDWIPHREPRNINGRYETRNISGQAVVIPENFDEILTTKYGNWREPVDFKVCGHGIFSDGAIPPEYTDGIARKVDEKRIRDIG